MVSYAYVVIRVIVMGTNRLDASLKTIIKNHEKAKITEVNVCSQKMKYLD